MKVAVIVAVLLSVTYAAVVKRQALEGVPPPPPPPPQPAAERNVGGYTLPSGVELIIGSITGGFTCDAKIYGYYADQANNCQIFHVCVPSTLEEASPPLLYSFVCGNQTVFDQANLVCTNPQDAVPCEQAQDFYSVNENFGKTDTPPVRPQPGSPVVQQTAA